MKNITKETDEHEQVERKVFHQKQINFIYFVLCA